MFNPQRSGPWQPKFGLAAMMLATLVVCVMGAASYYLVRAQIFGTGGRALFVVFVVAAPVVLVVALSLSRWLLQWIDGFARRK